MRHTTTSKEQAGGSDPAAGSLVEGLATFAGAVAELPAVRATCLPELERGRVAGVLVDGWNLAAFTPTGALLLSVLDAGGASIELVGGVSATWARGRRGGGRGDVEGEGRGKLEGGGRAESGDGGDREGARDASIPRATSHGAVRAAWGAPPGRRIAAMGLVPGPDGELLRMSCGLVLRLPAAAILDPMQVAPLLAWHAAMHAAERQGLPAPARLAGAIEALRLAEGVPRRPAGRVAWARVLAARVAQELTVNDGRRSLAQSRDADIVDAN